MAFNPANFEYHTMTTGMSGVAQDAVVWKYTTTDNLSAIGDHYFDGVGSLDGGVLKNDWIAIIAGDGNAYYIVDDPSFRTLSNSAVFARKLCEVSDFTGMINIP